MMDLSDGLLKDGRRLAMASGVDIDFQASTLARDLQRLSPAAQRLGTDPLDWVLGGGEDHGLLATFSSEKDLPEGFRVVGIVLEASDASGEQKILVDGVVPRSAEGFDHFAG